MPLPLSDVGRVALRTRDSAREKKIIYLVVSVVPMMLRWRAARRWPSGQS